MVRSSWAHIVKYLELSLFHLQVQFLTAYLQINAIFFSIPYPSTLLSNMSGLLINTHPYIDYPRNLPPSYLEIGGFHLKKSKKLPHELLDFVEDPKSSGTILFVLGFTFDSNFIPDDIMRNYMEAFGNVTYKVIMRVEGSIRVPIPSNVKVVTWIPQADILAHPKTRLFVTHCGMHGVMEALTNGVPMLGLPVFADQEDVLVRLEEKGLAVRGNKFGSKEELQAAILQGATNQT